MRRYNNDNKIIDNVIYPSIFCSSNILYVIGFIESMINDDYCKYVIERLVNSIREYFFHEELTKSEYLEEYKSSLEFVIAYFRIILYQNETRETIEYYERLILNCDLEQGEQLFFHEILELSKYGYFELYKTIRPDKLPLSYIEDHDEIIGKFNIIQIHPDNLINIVNDCKIRINGNFYDVNENSPIKTSRGILKFLLFYFVIYCIKENYIIPAQSLREDVMGSEPR